MNRYYGTARDRRIYVTQEGKEYVSKIREGVKLSLGDSMKVLEGDLELYIMLKMGRKRKMDVDNCLKPLLDSLEGLLYKDDSQIRRLCVEKSFGHEDETIELLLKG